MAKGKMNNGPVTVRCYGKEKTFKTREAAIEMFVEGMMCCEGSERDRYTNIYLDLIEGKDYATDGCDF